VANISAADGTVYLKHYRRWKNVASRLLGPGTAYSLTYGWSTGVDETSGTQMELSVDQSTTDQENVSATVGASVGVSIPDVASVSVNTSLTVGGTFTQMLDQRFTSTLTHSVQISSQKNGSETESVSGVDNTDRVYTVWQLMDDYVYADSVSGQEITVASIQNTSAFPTASLPLASWHAVSIYWPEVGVLEQGTQVFAQETTDFPRSGGVAARTSVRLFQVP
jgi:hypothetical protein